MHHPLEPDLELRVAFVTAPDREVGRRLARGLVESHAAACVNLVPGVSSVYRWKGGVEENDEVLLIVKTTAARMAAVEAYLDTEHPYDVPECVAFAPRTVEDKYLRWWRSETAD